MLKKKKRVAEGGNLVVTDSAASLVSEQFRTLRSNINFSSRSEAIQSLVVTSAVEAEGKTTIAANLAAVYAQEGKKVLLLDSDMRRPTAHIIFDLRNNMGLTTFLNGEATLKEVIYPTFVDQLDLLPSGPEPSNPAELLASNLMENLMHQVKELYDMVIFDSPPLLSVTDGQIIANRCDASILVINTGETDQEHVVQAKETLALANSKLIGVILNNFTSTKTAPKYQK